MSFGANVVKKVQDAFKVRPMMPFGMSFEIGTIGIVEDDQFSTRGTVESVLKIPRGSIVQSRQSSNWQATSGEDVELNILGDGEASALFPAAPKANVKIEVSFSKAESFLVTVNNLTISTLREPLALIEAMQDAYRRGVWRKDYILIYETVTPAETLLLLSRSAGTKLLLTADTKVAPAGLADIAGKFSLSYQSEDLMRFASGGQPLFYNAYRVKESFWTGNLAAETFGADDPTGGILEHV